MVIGKALSWIRRHSTDLLFGATVFIVAAGAFTSVEAWVRGYVELTMLIAWLTAFYVALAVIEFVTLACNK